MSPTTLSLQKAALSEIARRVPWADAGALALIVLLIGGPALFTKNGFALDFTNHLWLVWVQARAISEHLAPTYFVNAGPVGVFYPFFVFYGGTLYAAAGGLADLLGGHVVVAYVGVILLATGGAYGGLVWLSRQLGVRSWMAHAPAVTFVTSAYYVTNLYGRGAWTEYVATSTIPLLVASALRLARAHRIELWPAALFVVAAVFFSGSHDITLLLGAVVMLAGLLVLWFGLGRPAVFTSPHRMIALIGLLLLALGVNAWFLLANLVHASQTEISRAKLSLWSGSAPFNTPGMLFNPLRAVPRQSTTPALFVQAPDWFLFWVLIVAAMLWPGAHRQLRRAGCAVTVVLLALLALIMIGPLWDALPRPIRAVQLPYRLNTYVALTVAGLVLVCVLAVERAEVPRTRQWLGGILAAAMAISIGLCAWQVWIPNADFPSSYRDRSGVFVSTNVTPRSWYDEGNYADASQPLVTDPRGSVTIEPSLAQANRASVKVAAPPGLAPFATNISGGPYVVKLSGGAVRAGRTRGGATVARRRQSGTGPIVLTMSAAGGALVAGRWITLLALAILFVLTCCALASRWRNG